MLNNIPIAAAFSGGLALLGLAFIVSVHLAAGFYPAEVDSTATLSGFAEYKAWAVSLFQR